MKYSFLTALSILCVPALATAENSFVVTIAPAVTAVSSLSVFVKVTEGGQGPGGFVAPTFLSVAAGERLDFNVSYVDLTGSAQYSFLGIYGASGVVVAVDSRVAGALVGRTWESVFPGYAESAVNATLATFINGNVLDDDYVGAFAFGRYLSTLRVTTNGTESELFAPLGSPSTLLNFSQATLNGFANMQAVPEPGTWALFAAGLGVLGAAARRRKANA
jgi:hypothetical protein